jgi:hypothetical protein
LFLGKIIARLLFAKCIDSMTLQGRRKTFADRVLYSS